MCIVTCVYCTHKLKRLIWHQSQFLLLTAIHSLRSSPSGSMTAIRRFPLPSVASACLSSSYWWDPSGMFFFGLNVFDERFPLDEIGKYQWQFRTRVHVLVTALTYFLAWIARQIWRQRDLVHPVQIDHIRQSAFFKLKPSNNPKTTQWQWHHMSVLWPWRM